MNTSLLRRLKIIKGQMEGLEKMLEKKAPCEEVFPQVKAIKNAFSSLSTEMLKLALKECFPEGKNMEKAEKMLESVGKM